MRTRVLLDKNNHVVSADGRAIKSNIMHIPVGHTALLSLYNMINMVKLRDADEQGRKDLINESCLSLRKLSFGDVDEQQINADDLCGARVNLPSKLRALLDSRRVFSEPIYQNCCSWSIDPSNNFVLVPVPGFFELETADFDQLDVMYIEYTLLTVAESASIPDGFKLGG